jgi:hypothetical protein
LLDSVVDPFGDVTFFFKELFTLTGLLTVLPTTGRVALDCGEESADLFPLVDADAEEGDPLGEDIG